jgi:endonuclease YncB( thermonuclease family)
MSPLSPRAIAQDARGDTPEGIPEGAVAGEVSSHASGRQMTVVLDGKKRTVMLLGVDAPLLDVGEFGECYAPEAQRQLRKLAPKGETVYLESDPDLDKDDEGRLLRYVWVIRDDKPVHLNFRMIRDGFADLMDDEVEDSPYREAFEKALESAKDNDRGLWAECGSAHKKTSPPPTPTPTVDERKAEYVFLSDPREILTRPFDHFGEKYQFCGEILTIQVAPPGRVLIVGDQEAQPYGAFMQVWVSLPDGSQEPLAVGFSGNTAGMFEGSYVCVWGTLVDTATGTNAFGGTIVNPLFAAQFVELQ